MTDLDIQNIYEERFNPDEEYLLGKGISKKDPVVSVCIATYQHKHYIKKCIEGVLMQKTDFPIEIIIGEDESSDGTREICKIYAEEYPEQIRLFLRDRDTSQLYDSMGNYICRFNGKWNRKSAHGKYIAMCEGDDYWTDPRKLQKEVDFLEENEKYAGCYTNYKVIDENGSLIRRSGLSTNQKKDLSHLNILSLTTPKTLTVLFRSSALPEKYPSELHTAKNGDTFLFGLISRKGSFGYLDINSGAYRIHQEGVWSMVDELKQEKEQIKTCRLMLAFFKSKDEQKSIYHRLYNSFIKLMKIHIKRRNYIKGVYWYLKILFYSPEFWFKRTFGFLLKPWIKTLN